MYITHVHMYVCVGKVLYRVVILHVDLRVLQSCHVEYLIRYALN
jgi:hypothetical protein